MNASANIPVPEQSPPLESVASLIEPTLQRFSRWLDSYGETSQDHQDFYASKIGARAKALYYRRPALGTLAVMPMVFCEAFAPWTRRWFYPRMRLPISDAHYAMGFAYLYQVTRDNACLQRAHHFLDILKETRCPGDERWGWGYPFDWQTVAGVLPRGTPLITTTPYCYEAFASVHEIDGDARWRDAMHRIAEHCLVDYQEVTTGPGAASCSYTPSMRPYVVNASAYRAMTLVSGWQEFGDDRYREAAERNIHFVLGAQREDGSWPYATDGSRDFVDHFHTCFVMKALAKTARILWREKIQPALDRGVAYYTTHLFDADGLPKPFARAPRLIVYRRELYDCAEAINLGVLLRGQYPELDRAVDATLHEILTRWVLPNGAFRSRKLLVGWDNVPMHRWGHSEMFRALALARWKLAR